MKIFQPGKLYLPALVIVAIVLLLLVFIGFSTYWNLNRARSNALNFIHQQGVATLQILEAGARSLQASPKRREEAFGSLITEVAGEKNIAYIYVANQKKGVLYPSGFSGDDFSGIWLPEISDDNETVSRFSRLSDGTPIYELAKRYMDTEDLIVIGLKMSTFETASQEDLHHAVIMVSILMMLAAGAVFFIFVIQRYHRVNRTLNETRDYMEQVIDSMANGLLSIDINGRVLSHNNLVLALLGLTKSDIDHMDLNRLIDFKTSGIAQTLSESVSIMDREIVVNRFSGGKIPLAVSVTPIISGAGRCTGAVIILRDLTVIKRLEEKIRRSEKLAAIGKLAAAVAHEIRNPLSSIRGFAKFLEHVLRDQPKEKEYAMVMVKEVDRINRVVTDLLNLARPLKIEAVSVDPKRLVDHTVRLMEGDAASRGITLVKNMSDAPATVALDPNLFTQVLLNLALNALQAAEAGQTIEIGAAMGQADGRVMFWVEDEGPGIPADHINRIFDPFFTTREKGTGLGLAIVHKIVENHQGTVRAFSPPPGRHTGCLFVIDIPINPEQTIEKEA